MTEPLVYTAHEAAALLRVSRTHVSELIARGELVKVRTTSRRVLIARTELERFVAAGVGGGG